jgi:uncharacterized protein (TIGR03435 family)
MISLLRGSLLLLFLAMQAGAQKRSFEVASIKKSSQPYNTLRMTGDRFFGQGWTLIDLLKFAYATCDEFLLDSQIVGGPPWANSDHFEIDARAGGNDAVVPRCDMQVMIQSLLVDRFHVKAHLETRDLPVYQMTVVKTGKLKLSEDQTPPVMPATPSFDPTKPMPRGTFLIAPGPSGTSSMIITGTAIPISRFMKSLQNASPEFRDRLIVDKTGLQGLFDLKLQFAEAPSVRQPAGESPYPALSTAIQEQLGLKLESRKMRADVMVIDSIQRPTAD